MKGTPSLTYILFLSVEATVEGMRQTTADKESSSLVDTATLRVSREQGLKAWMLKCSLPIGAGVISLMSVQGLMLSLLLATE